MKNGTTPRTLAECEFTTGYANSPLHPEPHTSPASVILALLIGIVMAILLASWWAS